MMWTACGPSELPRRRGATHRADFGGARPWTVRNQLALDSLVAVAFGSVADAAAGVSARSFSRRRNYRREPLPY